MTEHHHVISSVFCEKSSRIAAHVIANEPPCGECGNPCGSLAMTEHHHVISRRLWWGEIFCIAAQDFSPPSSSK